MMTRNGSFAPAEKGSETGAYAPRPGARTTLLLLSEAIMKRLWIPLLSSPVLTVLALSLGAAGPGQAQSGPGYAVTILSPPTALQAGQNVKLRIRYEAPLAPTPLNIQLQTHVGWIVIASVTKRVSGRGAIQAAVVIPGQAIGNEVRFGAWLGTDWRHPLGPTFFTPFVRVQTTAQAVQLRRQAARDAKVRAAFLARHGATDPRTELIGIYQSSASVWPTNIEAGLAQRLQTAGFAICRLSSAELAENAIVSPDVLPTLLIDDIATVPSAAVPVIGHYVASGGHLVALGGPAFSHLRFQLDGAWVGRAQFLKQAKRNLIVHRLALPQAAGGWGQDSSASTTLSHIRFVASAAAPASDGGAYRMDINLNRWCTFRPRNPFAIPAMADVTVFWAKGDPHTHCLTLEWDERDGSRWTITVALHGHWTHYVLPERAFIGWPHPQVPGRFFLGDHLHLDHVVGLRIGLVAPTPPPGRHVVYFAGLGTAALPAGEARRFAAALQPRFDAPIIDTISPAYKLFRVTDMKTLAPAQAGPRSLAPASGLPAPHSTLAIVARPQATGLDKHRAERYLPLLVCRDAKGRFVGAAAALVLPATAAQRPRTTLSVPVTDPTFFVAPATQQWLVDVIRWMNRGVYLAEGGTQKYACFTGAAMPIGAVVENHSPTPQPVRVISTATGAGGKIVFQHTFVGTIRSESSQKFAATWTPPAARGWESVYRVTTTLSNPKSKTVDRLTQQFRVLGANPHPHFVTVRSGEFYLNGKRWYPFGVNYVPSSDIGQESWDLWENFFSRYDYAPTAVERDLEDIKAMGFNMISTLVHVNDRGEMAAGNVLDLLARCHELGLKVNFALASNGPMHFNWKLDKQWIHTLHLAQNDTVFAYDVAWEPHWGDQAMRRQYDPLWRQWIVAHYGSLAKAQAVWHCRAPRWRNQVTNPTDRQFDGETPAHAMVIAYRRFLNGLLEKRYGRAQLLIHSIDPHHLVSFRMSYAGGVNAHMGAWTPYDLWGLSHAVDFFAPEGYAVIGQDRTRCLRYGLFTLAYARACNPALPVIYAEFGTSVFDPITLRDSESLERLVALQYANFYNMLLRGGANGAVCWFFPGGYRVDERSDYGVINPDRSWRPVSYVIHRFAPRFETPHPRPRPDVVFPVVRSRAEGGAPEIYARLSRRWQAVVDAGRLPGLKFVQGQK